MLTRLKLLTESFRTSEEQLKILNEEKESLSKKEYKQRFKQILKEKKKREKEINKTNPLKQAKENFLKEVQE